MIFLVSQSEVESRMGMPSVPEAVDVILSAVQAAHLRVQGILGTKFDQTSNIDLFLLDSAMTGGIVPAGYFRLRLKNGLLRAAPVPTVLCGNSADDQTEVVVGYKIDSVRGIVYVPQSYAGYFVKVSYDSGYTTNEAPEPELKEAVLSYTTAILHFAPANKPPQVILKEMDPVARAENHGIDVLRPLLRTVSFALNPVY